MASRAPRPDETPPPPSPPGPRPEQLIETHKAWIAAAAAMPDPHRRRARLHRTLAVCACIVAAGLLGAALAHGPGGTTASADPGSELVSTLAPGGAFPAGSDGAEPADSARADRAPRGRRER